MRGTGWEWEPQLEWEQSGRQTPSAVLGAAETSLTAATCERRAALSAWLEPHGGEAEFEWG